MNFTDFESPRRDGSTGEIGFPIRGLPTVVGLILQFPFSIPLFSRYFCTYCGDLDRAVCPLDRAKSADVTVKVAGESPVSSGQVARPDEIWSFSQSTAVHFPPCLSVDSRDIPRPGSYEPLPCCPSLPRISSSPRCALLAAPAS